MGATLQIVEPQRTAGAPFLFFLLSLMLMFVVTTVPLTRFYGEPPVAGNIRDRCQTRSWNVTALHKSAIFVGNGAPWWVMEDLTASSLRFAACPFDPPYIGQGWRAVAGRLASSPPRLKLVVFGGSETSGADCHAPDGRTNKACSWPARLGVLLGHLLPGTAVQTLNFALGGTTSSAALPILPLALREHTDADIVAFDFLVNDAVSQNAATLVAHEALISAARRAAPEAMLMLINACGLEECASYELLLQQVAGRHSLAVVSYRGFLVVRAQVLKLDLSATVKELFASGAGARTHPAWYVHHAIAALAAACFADRLDAIFDASCVPVGVAPAAQSFSPPEQLNAVMPCATNATDYVATVAALSPGGSFYGVVSDGWRLFEDRPNKPGWIAERDGARLAFELRFGAAPRIVFSVLRSYTGLGNVLMTFDDNIDPLLPRCKTVPERQILIPGLYTPEDAEWGLNHSTSTAFFWEVWGSGWDDAHKGLGGNRRFNILPFSKRNVTFEACSASDNDAVSFKFKLISVAAC